MINGNPGRALRYGFLVALLVLATPLVLFAAELAQAFWHSSIDSALSGVTRALGPALISLAAASLSLVFVVVLSLGFASLALQSAFAGDIPSSRALCIGLGVAIVPFFLGGTSFAFLWAVPLEPLMGLPLIAERGFPSVILVDLLAQILRYVPLLTWLLIATGLDADGGRVFYERVGGFRTRDFIRDELGFKWALLCMVVGAFAFQDTANDYVITYLALRPSPATETELISHFLQREFIANTIGRSAQHAIDMTLICSAAFGLASMAVFACISAPLLRLRRISAFHYRHEIAARDRFRRLAPRASASIVLLILLAIALALTFRLFQLNYDGWELARTLGRTALLSLFAAAASWLVAALLAFGVRDATALADGSAQRRLMLIAAVAVAVGFIPAIGVAVAVQSLLFQFIGTGSIAAAVAWFVAQSIRLIPVLAIFMIPSLLALEDERVDYLRHVGPSFVSRCRLLFLGPLKTTHLAFLLIAWGWILNEGVISAIFQSDIPSFSELLLRATSGRSAAYPVAATLVAIEALVFTFLCANWAWRVYCGWRGRNAITATR